MKTKEEILQRIAEINNRLFNIDMVDHWQQEDRETYDRLTKEKIELEKKLEKLENE